MVAYPAPSNPNILINGYRIATKQSVLINVIYVTTSCLPIPKNREKKEFDIALILP